MPEPESLYDILNVARDASHDEIKAAWRRAAAAAHPDRAGGSVERMSQVNQAWEVLGDAHRRAAYDAEGKTGRDNALDNARQMLRNEFRKAMSIPGTEERDLVQLVRNACHGIRSNARNARVNVEAQLRLLDRRMKRLKGPKHDNLFLEVLKDAHDEATRGLTTIDDAIAAVDVAEKILADYGWDAFADFGQGSNMFAALLGGNWPPGPP